MTLAVILAEDRRLVILRTLSEVPTFSSNEGILRRALAAIGHPEATKDLVRADLEFLERHSLIRIEKLAMQTSGELLVAHLLEAGADVANGQAHAGVARRTPGG